MKTILISTCLALCCVISCSTNAQNNNMIIDFKLKREETSKDSNSKSVSIQVFDDKVIYIEEHWGFKAPKDKKKKFRINENERSEICKKFEALNLNKNLSEIKSTEGIGVSGYLKIDYNQEKTTSINIEGKKRIWGSDEYIDKNWGKEFVESKTNISNIDYFRKAEDFIFFIQSLI